MNYHSLNHYDPDSGFYFKSVTQEQKDSSRFSKKSSDTKMVNIGIFNPITEEAVVVFPATENVVINGFLFESGYDEEDSKISFIDRSCSIQNNTNLEKRKPIAKLLISTIEDEGCTLWECDKAGSNLKKITFVSDKEHWHLDVKNIKVRVVFSEDGELSVKSFPW